MSLERRVEASAISESCVGIEMPTQQFLLGPAPYVVREIAMENGPEIFDDPRPIALLLPVPHRYSA